MKNSAASSPGRRVWLHVRTRHVMFRVTSCRCLVCSCVFCFFFQFYCRNVCRLLPIKRKTVEALLNNCRLACEELWKCKAQTFAKRAVTQVEKKKNWKSCASSKQTKKKKKKESTLLALNQVLDNAWQRLDTQIDSISHEVSFVVNGSSPEHQEVQLHWGRTARSSKKWRYKYTNRQKLF